MHEVEGKEATISHFCEASIENKEQCDVVDGTICRQMGGRLCQGE